MMLQHNCSDGSFVSNFSTGKNQRIPEVYSQIFVTLVTLKNYKLNTTTSKFNK